MILDVWQGKKLEEDFSDVWQMLGLADCGARFTQKDSMEDALSQELPMW